MRKPTILAAFALAMLLGCNQPPTDPPAEETEATTPPASTAATEAPEQAPRVAQAGEGAHAQGYGGGIYTEPIRQRFLIEERLMLLQMQQALAAYRAENGRGPRTHEEFMEGVIEAYEIRLPELREGEEYEYDPEAIDDETNQPGVLMIVRKPAE